MELADDALVGTEGQGWEQVTAELVSERSGPERIYSSIVLLDRWIEWLRHAKGKDLKNEHVAAVGRFVAHLSTLRHMSITTTSKLAAGESPLGKDIGTAFLQEIPAMIETFVGEDPVAIMDPDLLRSLAFVSLNAPTFSLRGGTREILRGMIARGLGLR